MSRKPSRVRLAFAHEYIVCGVAGIGGGDGLNDLEFIEGAPYVVPSCICNHVTELEAAWKCERQHRRTREASAHSNQIADGDSLSGDEAIEYRIRARPRQRVESIPSIALFIIG